MTEEQEWRVNMTKYIVSTDSFKKDTLDGNISPELLESWGIVPRTDMAGSIVFHLKDLI